MVLSQIIYVIFFLKLSFGFPLRIMSHSKCDLQNCLHCDSIDESTICTECINGYYRNMQSECIKCNDHCLSCTISKCIECENNYVLSDSQCVLSLESESYKKEFIPLVGCLNYNNHYECIKCAPGYQLKNGKCDDSLMKIIGIVLLVIVGIVILIFAVYTLIRYKKRNRANNNVPVVANNQQTNIALNQNENINHNPVVLAKELNESLTSTQSKGLNCYKCDNEQAEYQLSCGCCFCKNDIGLFVGFNDKETFEKYYGKEQKCILCKEKVTKVSLLKYECGICLELKHHTYHLNCGCNFELCANCYNKMRTTKLCPGCRKPFDSYIPIIRNNSSK